VSVGVREKRGVVMTPKEISKDKFASSTVAVNIKNG
jgi:hypothetical protein